VSEWRDAWEFSSIGICESSHDLIVNEIRLGAQSSNDCRWTTTFSSEGDILSEFNWYSVRRLFQKCSFTGKCIERFWILKHWGGVRVNVMVWGRISVYPFILNFLNLQYLTKIKTNINCIKVKKTFFEYPDQLHRWWSFQFVHDNFVLNWYINCFTSFSFSLCDF
jgi:hypothetical protein